MKVVAVNPVGDDALTVVYKDAAGQLGEQMVFRGDEARLSLTAEGRPWSFDGDGENFRLAAEAYRIHLAHLFDPVLAVHTSDVEPLPHQITAVYESMLPRQPLRFLLADDPGAGKTIMAGLLIRELMLRGDVRRCLVVTPGALAAQWQDELNEKFGVTFDIFGREMVEASATGNPFADPPDGGLKFVEVKGRVRGARTVTVTRNEILTSLNQPDKFVLGVVPVDGEEADGPHYIRRPFSREPEFGVTSVNYDLGELMRLRDSR